MVRKYSGGWGGALRQCACQIVTEMRHVDCNGNEACSLRAENGLRLEWTVSDEAAWCCVSHISLTAFYAQGTYLQLAQWYLH